MPESSLRLQCRRHELFEVQGCDGLHHDFFENVFEFTDGIKIGSYLFSPLDGWPKYQKVFLETPMSLT